MDSLKKSYESEKCSAAEEMNRNALQKYKRRIPIENRGKIVALRDMGLSYRKIAAWIGCSVGAVYKVAATDRHCS